MWLRTGAGPDGVQAGRRERGQHYARIPKGARTAQPAAATTLPAPPQGRGGNGTRISDAAASSRRRGRAILVAKLSASSASLFDAGVISGSDEGMAGGFLARGARALDSGSEIPQVAQADDLRERGGGTRLRGGLDPLWGL